MALRRVRGGGTVHPSTNSNAPTQGRLVAGHTGGNSARLIRQVLEQIARSELEPGAGPTDWGGGSASRIRRETGLGRSAIQRADDWQTLPPKTTERAQSEPCDAHIWGTRFELAHEFTRRPVGRQRAVDVEHAEAAVDRRNGPSPRTAHRCRTARPGRRDRDRRKPGRCSDQQVGSHVRHGRGSATSRVGGPGGYRASVVDPSWAINICRRPSSTAERPRDVRRAVATRPDS